MLERKSCCYFVSGRLGVGTVDEGIPVHLASEGRNLHIKLLVQRCNLGSGQASASLCHCSMRAAPTDHCLNSLVSYLTHAVVQTLSCFSASGTGTQTLPDESECTLGLC